MRGNLRIRIWFLGVRNSSPWVRFYVGQEAKHSELLKSSILFIPMFYESCCTGISTLRLKLQQSRTGTDHTRFQPSFHVLNIAISVIRDNSEAIQRNNETCYWGRLKEKSFHTTRDVRSWPILDYDKYSPCGRLSCRILLHQWCKWNRPTQM